MGNATDDRPSLRATVICAGGENCGKRFDYQGIQTCAAAASIAGGPSACAYGCLGLGDCTRACKFDAIHLEKVNDTHGRGYFRTLLTVASNAPAAGRRFVRKKLQH